MTRDIKKWCMWVWWRTHTHTHDLLKSKDFDISSHLISNDKSSPRIFLLCRSICRAAWLAILDIVEKNKKFLNFFSKLNSVTLLGKFLKRQFYSHEWYVVNVSANRVTSRISVLSTVSWLFRILLHKYTRTHVCIHEDTCIHTHTNFQAHKSICWAACLCCLEYCWNFSSKVCCVVIVYKKSI